MEKLKQYMEEKGLTQANLCAVTKIEAGSLCRILQGKQLPSLKNAVRIEKATRGRVKPKDWV